MTGDPSLWQDRPVLVTGGAGFIGSHLVDSLVARGARVTVLDDLSTGFRGNLSEALASGRVTWVEGDLRRREDCRRAVLGGSAEGRPVDVVFHQAALGSVPRSLEDPATTLAVNATGTAELFTAARDAGAKRIVYASSSSVYGDSDRLPKRVGEEGRPLSPYALSKQASEELAAVFARSFGMDFVGLRYFNVYGPRQSPEGPYAAVIPRFFDAYRRGEAPVIHGDGEQTRDFTNVADAVAANLAAGSHLLESNASNKVAGTLAVVNVGGGRGTTINNLASTIADLLGGGPAPVHTAPRPGDVRASLADLADAEALLGYRPSVSLEEGLREIVRQQLSG
jgi:nucleoside-diphosphate-sugar epimerase